MTAEEAVERVNQLLDQYINGDLSERRTLVRIAAATSEFRKTRP